MREFVSTHSRLKAAGNVYFGGNKRIKFVSTHSRLKAAGFFLRAPCGTQGRFNTQPPEGGWVFRRRFRVAQFVSTHSRLKAAGTCR